jgi:hypothetical protein
MDVHMFEEVLLAESSMLSLKTLLSLDARNLLRCHSSFFPHLRLLCSYLRDPTPWSVPGRLRFSASIPPHVPSSLSPFSSWLCLRDQFLRNWVKRGEEDRGGMLPLSLLTSPAALFLMLKEEADRIVGKAGMEGRELRVGR